MLKLYGFSKVNAVGRGHTRDLRVLWALEEMGLPFELAGMGHPAHDLNTDAYRQLNPFEQFHKRMQSMGPVAISWGDWIACCAKSSPSYAPMRHKSC